MGNDLEAGIADLASDFVAWRFDRMAEFYASPLPIFAEDRIVTHLTRSDLVAWLLALRLRFAQDGMVGLRGRLVARGMPRQGRERIIVDWTYDMGPDRPSRTSSVTYFCRDIGARGWPRCRWQVEMIEYRRLAYPIAEGGFS